MKVPEPRKLPSGSWFIQLRLGGESIPVTAGTKTECVNAAQLIKAEHRAGKRQASGPGLTLRAAIDNYISARSNILSPPTIRGYNTIKNNRFVTIMDKPVKSISDWQKICNAEAGICAPKTLKNSWSLLASALREYGFTLPKVTLPQVVCEDRPYLEPDQVVLFIKAVKGNSCEIPALLALHSLRRSEICALTWDKIDFVNRRIKVSGAMVPNEHHKFVLKKSNKNRSSQRYVPIMIPELTAALLKCEKKEGLVITCSPETILKRIVRVCEQYGFPQLGAHGLRHSFASLAYHLGVPEKIAMQIGGWADRETMSKIYTHLAQKDIAKYETEMSRFFNNANNNVN